MEEPVTEDVSLGIPYNRGILALILVTGLRIFHFDTQPITKLLKPLTKKCIPSYTEYTPLGRRKRISVFNV